MRRWTVNDISKQMLTNTGPATQKQRGIVSFGIAPNRQNPFAGAGHDAVFNTWRRFSRQVLYWAPAFITGYYVMQWATERYVKTIVLLYQICPRSVTLHHQY